MIETKQYKMRDEDKKLLILPKLSDDILEQIFQIKKKYNLLILISLIFCKFGLNLTWKLTQQTHQSQYDVYEENLLIQWSSFLIGNVFIQIMIGFMTDLISVQVSWAFTTVISLLGIIIQIIYFDFGNDQIFTVGQVVINCAFVSNYVCGSFILFNTSYKLTKRFNQTSLFVLLGTSLSNLISFILTKYIKINIPSIKIIITICLVVVFVGGVIVYYIYKKIEDIKKQSGNYQMFLRYQGFGLNFKSIGYYYFNKNFMFLSILSFFGKISAEANISQQFQDILKTKQGQAGYSETFVTLIEISSTIGLLLIFQFLVNYVNNERKFITIWYKSQVLILKISFVLNLITSIIVYLSPDLPFIPLLITFFLSSIIQEISEEYCNLICIQINYCLSDEKCSIKCIGLGILGFFQDLPQILFMTPIDTFLSFVIQTQIVLLTTIYSLYYLENRSFENLEKDVKEQYNVKINDKNTKQNTLQSLL